MYSTKTGLRFFGNRLRIYWGTGNHWGFNKLKVVGRGFYLSLGKLWCIYRVTNFK